MTDQYAKARELTAQIGQTKDYRRWLNNLHIASQQVRMLRDERGVARDAIYQDLAELEQWVGPLRQKCDLWLEEHEYLLAEEMARLVE